MICTPKTIDPCRAKVVAIVTNRNLAMLDKVLRVAHQHRDFDWAFGACRLFAQRARAWDTLHELRRLI
jgi:hypothetical protein